VVGGRVATMPNPSLGRRGTVFMVCVCPSVDGHGRLPGFFAGLRAPAFKGFPVGRGGRQKTALRALCLLTKLANQCILVRCFMLRRRPPAGMSDCYE